MEWRSFVATFINPHGTRHIQVWAQSQRAAVVCALLTDRLTAETKA